MMKSVLAENSLTQRAGSNFKNFDIHEEGLLIEFQKDNTYYKYSIDFEKLEFEEFITNKSKSKLEIITFISTFFNIALVATLLFFLGDGNSIVEYIAGGLLVGSVIVFAFWSKQLKKNIKLKFLKNEDKLIEFYYRDTDMKYVDQFINILKSEKMNYIRKKYLKIDEFIPAERQAQDFLWMYQNNKISKMDYGFMMEELNNLRDR